MSKAFEKTLSSAASSGLAGGTRLRIASALPPARSTSAGLTDGTSLRVSLISDCVKMVLPTTTKTAAEKVWQKTRKETPSWLCFGGSAFWIATTACVGHKLAD